MIYKEEIKDIFTVSDDYYLTHCIASDLMMGAGIAVPMQNKFNIRYTILKNKYNTTHPCCILTNRVFNLITKRSSGGKPTYESLKASLESLKDMMLAKGLSKIASPKIGCGIDGLDWNIVSEIIKNIFKDTDIEWLTCIWS